MFVETRWVASRRVSAGGMSWRLGAGIAFADMTAETRIAAVWAGHMSAGRACVGSYGKYSQKAAGTLESEYAPRVRYSRGRSFGGCRPFVWGWLVALCQSLYSRGRDGLLWWSMGF